MSEKKRIPAAGSQFRVESSVTYVKRGNHDTGTPRNEGLPLPEKDYLRSDRNEDYAPVPEYAENKSGGRSKCRAKVPANKSNASKPSGARPDNNPDDKYARSTSGPVPTDQPVSGAAPRHPLSKPVTSTPDGGPRQAKGKDSTNVNDSVSYGKGYGDRSPVGNPTIKKRSDVVPLDSSMIHSDNNPKRRESAYAGINRESLKDAKKLGK